MRRAAPIALALAAAAFAACFDGEVPTEQIGGTQYGMLLNLTPPRVPLGVVRTRIVTGQPGALDSLVVTLANFKPLEAPAAYAFYAVGAGPGDTVPVTAALTRIRNDSVPNAAGGATVTRTVTSLGTSPTFEGTFNNDTIIARFAGAQFGGASRQFLVVTIQANAASPAFTASTPQPVWYRYRSATAPNNVVVTSAGATTFGNFDLTAPRQYAATGRGRSVFWDINADGRLVFSAIVEQVTQPPRGYFYQPWIRDTRTGRAVAIGPFTDDAGTPLRDADQLEIPGTSAQLPVGRFQTSEQAVGAPLNAFDGVYLILEPKLGIDSTHALTTVLQGIVGDTIGLRGLGALAVTVRRGGTAVAGAQVVAVAEGARAASGEPRPAMTDDAGVATIQRLPAGRYSVIVTSGTTTVNTAPALVTVVRQDTVATAVTLP